MNLKISIFTFSLLLSLVCTHTFSNDTIPGRKNFFIAYDISRPVLYFITNNINQQEISFGYSNVKRKFSVTGDLGMGSFLFDRKNYEQEINGVFFKVGLDKISVDQAGDYLSYGFRLAYSGFTNDFKGAVLPDINFGDLPLNVQQTQLNAFWVEGLVKLDIHIFKNLGLGWTARIKFPLKIKSDKYFKPYYVPGFGKTMNNLMVGFNYYLYYKIPLKY